MLDAIFPGHGIEAGAALGRSRHLASGRWSRSPSPSSRRAAPVRVVILDEPTSSLDASRSADLLAHVRRFVAGGGAVVFISHILSEVLAVSDRIVVMKDGARGRGPRRRTGSTPAASSRRWAASRRSAPRRGRRGAGAEPVLRGAPGPGLAFRAERGEIVGLAGLAGHGQTAMLRGALSGEQRRLAAEARPAGRLRRRATGRSTGCSRSGRSCATPRRRCCPT